MILFDIIRKKNITQIINRYEIKIKISMHILILFGFLNRAYFQIQSVQKTPFYVEDYIPVLYQLIFVSIRYGIFVYLIWLLFKIVKYVLRKASNHRVEPTP
jgi:hypothetical protein